MAQAINTQAKASTIQAQAMMSQANKEVYLKRTNMLVLWLPFERFYEDESSNVILIQGWRRTQDILDEVYKILYAMGVSTTEKAELASYRLNDVAQAWYNKWKESRALRGVPVA